MALLRRHERRNNSRANIWDELEELDNRVTALVIGDPITYEDNTGETGLTTLALPAATTGLEYVVERTAPYEYRVDPNGTDYFAGSSAGLYKSLQSNGAYIYIKCLKAGVWHILASVGTITDE